MDAVTTRWFSGPMVVVTAFVAVGWVVLAVAGWLGLGAPWNVVFAAVGVVGAAVTTWLASSLRVPYDHAGVHLPGQGHVAWSEVQAIDVTSGTVSVPVLSVRRGRALVDVPLDGLAWFGGPDGTARHLAERVARVAGVAGVGVRAARPSVGRRAA